MLISIITPTYKRPSLLKKSIESVINQSYVNWELIIVNDSPDYDYKELEASINNLKDSRIKYFKNKKNMGVNYSRNFALDNLSSESDFVFFLDDDDELIKNSLSKQIKILKKNNINWLLTLTSGGSGNVSFNNKNLYEFDFLKDSLIKRKLKGDFSQIIKTKIIKDNKIYFSKKIHQAEEWIFYMKISRHTKAFYYPIITKKVTYLINGLSNNTNLSIKNIFLLFTEINLSKRIFLEYTYVLGKIINTLRKMFL